MHTSLNNRTCANIRGGTQRGNKMAARRVGQKVFDWSKLDAIVPANLKPDYLKVKREYEAKKGR